MIISDPKDFPNLPDGESIALDVETTSFNEKQSALEPYQGHRICGVAFCLLRDPNTAWYIPMRHHTAIANENAPLDAAKKYLRDLLSTGRDWINQKVKFDAHFLAQDNIFTKGRMLDLMVINRLVNNTLPSYSLDAVAKKYLNEEKGKAPTAYLKSIRSKDFGQVPAEVLGRYAERDVNLTARLMHRAEGRLPPFSKRLWEDVEIPLTKVLFMSERRGVLLDTVRMKHAKMYCLREMLAAAEKCSELAEEEWDPGSTNDKTRILIGKFGIEPMNYTKTGQPQWTQLSLDHLSKRYPICKHVATYSKMQHFLSTYIEGWEKRTDTEGRMHPDFRQSGTKTGRLSCSDPNMQSVPIEAEGFIMVPEEYVLFSWDWSQIEYRFFGHYANDQTIIQAYVKDERTDFHQYLADQLGVERQFAKQLNFSFLYGMGKKLLLKNIAGRLQLAGEDDPEMRATMLRNFEASATGKKVREKVRQITIDEENKQLAESIYAEYHLKFPSIRELSRRVERVLSGRGWIKNYYGRRYFFDAGYAYKAVNYLIQGSAADFLKDRAVAMSQEVCAKYGAHLIVNIHDALLFAVPLESAVPFYLEAKRVMETAGLRLPVIVEGRVARRCWGQIIKLDPYEKNGKKIERSIKEAIEKSPNVAMRTWGKYHTADEKKVRGRYSF